MSTETFMRCFGRFTARRGIPSTVVSDNGKTFKSAAKIIEGTLNDPSVKRYFIDLKVEWKFNLEKAPWQGGVFEKMIKSAKRCLKRAIGKTSLTYDELLTLVTEVEAVLNSRPLSYITEDDFEEPLTPSHLMLGYRVLSLPDSTAQEEPEYSPTPEDLSRRMKHVAETSRKFWI